MSDYYDELAGSDDLAIVDGWRHWLEQWLRFEVVRRGLGIGDKDNIVDLGCGTGRLFRYLGPSRAGKYVGVDRLGASIERARKSYGDDGKQSFLHADLDDVCVDEAGPFDFAIAIGVLVDGDEVCSDVQRRQKLRRTMGRLNKLGQRGWALVMLNQDVLDADAIRRLEPSLQGASVAEIRAVLSDMDIDAAIDSEALPSDLFVICSRDEEPKEIEKRLVGDTAHRAVLERADAERVEFDEAHRAWLWLVSGRLEKAEKAISEIPDGHQRKALLEERLRLLKG